MLSTRQILEHHDSGTSWPLASGMSVPVAYEHALAVRGMRIARGERPLGYKVGFTNRNIWPLYGVYAPIWGTVWDTTVTFCEGRGRLTLDRTCEPRLEPEAVFGIAATPPANPAFADLYACIAWVAPGFEVVHTHMPGWKFEAGDTVADQGLHARLLVGRRMPVQAIAGDAVALEAALAAARVRLHHGDTFVEEGRGANVLDGPLHALLHFVQALRDCPGAPDLRPGDIVTTGTWTDAQPVAPGQRWRADFDAPLQSLEVQFS